MEAIFPPSATLIARAVLLVLLLLVLAGIGWWWIAPRTDWSRRLAFAPAQPVPFSHQHHVAGLGLDCRFCHSSVEVSARAGMPPTATCMTCHGEIWTNAALLAPVRQSFADHRPIAWKRVTDLPDYVYFNHSIHVAKGVGCASCHGDVAAMPLTWKARPLTMQFCLDCHRDPGPRLRPHDEVFDTGWRRTPATPSPAALLHEYAVPARNLTDCSVCHR